MWRICLGFAVVLALAAVLTGAELLVNGDFESAISMGWTQQVSGSDYTLNRDVAFHGDPDYEAQAHKYLTGYAMLSQTVSVPNANLFFCADMKFANLCDDNTYGYFAASAIRIEYLNASGAIIGETRIFNGTTNCDWTDTGTLHVISKSGDEWHRVGLLINEEVRNIPDLNIDDIARITVGIYAYSTDYC
jgi:hypothetical protein